MCICLTNCKIVNYFPKVEQNNVPAGILNNVVFTLSNVRKFSYFVACPVWFIFPKLQPSKTIISLLLAVTSHALMQERKCFTQMNSSNLTVTKSCNYESKRKTKQTTV